MKHTSRPGKIRYAVLFSLCLITSAAFTQDTSVRLTPVARPIVTRGIECFRVNVRRGRRSKVTQQVVVNYNTLSQILAEANPDSNIQFILVAIDKKFPGSESAFADINDKSGAQGMDTLHNKQAIIVKFSSRNATVNNINDENKVNPGSYTSSGSSLKSADKPFMPLLKNDKGKEKKQAPPFPSIYYAVGKLCPPPVCPGY